MNELGKFYFPVHSFPFLKLIIGFYQSSSVFISVHPWFQRISREPGR